MESMSALPKRLGSSLDCAASTAILPLSTNIAVEAAQSSEDPNLFGKALIDSMEGIKQEDSAPLLRDAWQVASNPGFAGPASPYNLVSDFRGRDGAGSD